MHRALMLKYRGAKLIRAGFIGVVLVVLVIAVGLAPERLVVDGRRRSGIRHSSPTPAASWRATT